MSSDAVHVQGLCRAAHQLGVVINNGYVVSFRRQVARNLPTNLTSATNDNFHDRAS